ncbi:hypothetical protein J5N97_015653 [Dioscorea zingiberensis]|uniref:Uncharacterized protein n=1 Tax=Dioscorea zingiberensis TaxID=325984 RepID=A0A9D5CJJ8_9LILI|nr:hypothetical protein J5N97_015653 [Dioscorea zingiberensis]
MHGCREEAYDKNPSFYLVPPYACGCRPLGFDQRNRDGARAREHRRSQRAMDEEGNSDASLTHQIKQLQRERDELRKDIEQLCMQQAGPSYLAVATRMHFQRTAGLEQEIENLNKKLARCTRDKQNLQEELSEAYRIKSQLADLHSAEVLKNKEAEKQLKFFQSSVAAVFAERDQALMESEKAKEHEETISQKLTELENRVEELRSAYLDEQKLNSTLQLELMQAKEQNEYFEKVVDKFFEIHERNAGFNAYNTWKEKCSCLLVDPSDKWTFNDDSESYTLKYIASLEEELGTLRSSVDKLQNNIRMGLDIEHHLKRKVKSLESEQIVLDDMITNGLSTLRDFQKQQRMEVTKILEDETSQLKSILVEIQNKFSQIHMERELKIEALQREKVSEDTECRDVHITIDSSVLPEKGDLPMASSTKKTLDASDGLSQALEEKVAVLLLLSQQEERHLLERDVNKALQKKVEELQRNLSQVTHEKVKALMELAQLKREYQLLHENSINSIKHSNSSNDSSEKGTAVHEQEGKLKNLFKRTYLRHWIGKGFSEHENEFSQGSTESSSVNKKIFSMDLARLKIENAALQESLANMERLTSSIHKLHVSLLKAKDDVKSDSPVDNIIETLERILVEANHMKTAIGSSLPVSWSADVDASIIYANLYEPIDSPEASKNEKVDPISAAGFEMVELLILATQLQKEIFIGKSDKSIV